MTVAEKKLRRKRAKASAWQNGVARKRNDSGKVIGGIRKYQAYRESAAAAAWRRQRASSSESMKAWHGGVCGVASMSASAYQHRNSSSNIGEDEKSESSGVIGGGDRLPLKLIISIESGMERMAWRNMASGSGEIMWRQRHRQQRKNEIMAYR